VQQTDSAARGLGVAAAEKRGFSHLQAQAQEVQDAVADLDATGLELGELAQVGREWCRQGLLRLLIAVVGGREFANVEGFLEVASRLVRWVEDLAVHARPAAVGAVDLASLQFRLRQREGLFRDCELVGHELWGEAGVARRDVEEAVVRGRGEELGTRLFVEAAYVDHGESDGRGRR